MSDKRGARLKVIRWTIDHAAGEFNVGSETLRKYLRTKGIEPGADRRYGTQDIVRAVYSDLDYERTELTREQKELTRLKKDKLAGILVFAEDAQRLWDSAVIALRQKIADAEIPEKTKQDILKDLQSIPIDEYASKDKTSPGADAEDESEVT